MRVRLPLFAALSISALFGCVKKESIDSADITTHGTSLELEVRNDGAQSHVYAAIHVGDADALVWAKLSAGDRLILKDPSGGQTLLPVVYEGDKTAYGTDLAPMEGVFTLDFVREKGISALGNKVEVPPGFTLKAPSAASRKEPLTFTWDAGTGSYSTTWTLDGSCIHHANGSVIGDPGTYTINAGEITTAGGFETKSCQATLKVVRRLDKNGCCSAEFGHTSRATGFQERSFVLTLNP